LIGIILRPVYSVYSWGTDPFNQKNIRDSKGNMIKEKRYLKAPITSIHFMNNYYGYIKVK
jgi:hypothetical protein